MEVVSDTVCPWCFVGESGCTFMAPNGDSLPNCLFGDTGKRRLEVAMARLKGQDARVEFEVRWYPYQLNPTAPAQGKGGCQEVLQHMPMYVVNFRHAMEQAVASSKCTRRSLDRTGWHKCCPI